MKLCRRVLIIFLDSSLVITSSNNVRKVAWMFTGRYDPRPPVTLQSSDRDIDPKIARFPTRRFRAARRICLATLDFLVVALCNEEMTCRNSVLSRCSLVQASAFR